MTVSTKTNSQSYVGDAATTVFPFTFSCLSANDIIVYSDKAEILVGVIVTLNTDQSSNAGGSVEITPAPAAGVAIDIVRTTDKSQQIAYDPYDPFSSASHEMALDKLTLIAQDEGQVSFIAPPTSSSPGSPGETAYDDNYFYICTALDTWKRIALEAF